MLWWMTCSIAHAQLHLGVEEWVEQLAPKVEELAGRSFVRRPSVAAGSRREVSELLLQPGPDGQQPSAARREQVERQLERSIAVYTHADEHIYVIEDAVEAAGLRNKASSAMVRCVLVHELVHALQHQYGLHSGRSQLQEDPQRGWHALIEGHANLLAMEYCTAEESEAITSELRAFQGTASPSSLNPDDPAVPYAWGPAVIQHLRDRDPDLVWAALLAPAPSWSQIQAALAPTLSSAWVDPDALRAAMATLDPSRPATKGHRASVALFDTMLGFRMGTEDVPVARAGWVQRSHTNELTATGVAFAFDEPDEALRLVMLRASSVGRMEDTYGLHRMTPLRGRVVPRTVGRLFRVRDVVGSLHLRVLGRDRTYHEVWAATDDVAVMATVYGLRPSRKRAIRALEEMLHDLPPLSDGPLDPEPLAGWMAEVEASRALLAATSSWDYRLHQVQRALRHEPELNGLCRRSFSRSLRSGAVPDPEPFAAAAWACAMAVGEPELAEATWDRFRHVAGHVALWVARPIADAGDGSLALAVLDRVPADDPLMSEIRALRAEIRSEGG